jgi:hypothetical protein
MRVRLFVWLLTVLIASAAPAFAKMESVVVHRDGLVNGVLLEEGDYKVYIAPDMESVSFYRRGEEIVTAPCEVSILDRRVMGDSIYYKRGADGVEVIRKLILVRPNLVIDLEPVSFTTEEHLATRREK